MSEQKSRPQKTGLHIQIPTELKLMIQQEVVDERRAGYPTNVSQLVAEIMREEIRKRRRNRRHDRQYLEMKQSKAAAANREAVEALEKQGEEPLDVQSPEPLTKRSAHTSGQTRPLPSSTELKDEELERLMSGE